MYRLATVYSVTDRQSDRQHYGANSRSYGVQYDRLKRATGFKRQRSTCGRQSVYWPTQGTLNIHIHNSSAKGVKVGPTLPRISQHYGHCGLQHSVRVIQHFVPLSKVKRLWAVRLVFDSHDYGADYSHRPRAVVTDCPMTMNRLQCNYVTKGRFYRAREARSGRVMVTHDRVMMR